MDRFLSSAGLRRRGMICRGPPLEKAPRPPDALFLCLSPVEQQSLALLGANCAAAALSDGVRCAGPSDEHLFKKSP